MIYEDEFPSLSSTALPFYTSATTERETIAATTWGLDEASMQTLSAWIRPPLKIVDTRDPVYTAQNTKKKDTPCGPCYLLELSRTDAARTRRFRPHLTHGRVIRIQDAVTLIIVSRLHVDSPPQRFTVRLSGVDTPDLHFLPNGKRQPGIRIRKALEHLMLHQVVSIKVAGHNKHGSIIARVSTAIHHQCSPALSPACPPPRPSKRVPQCQRVGPWTASSATPLPSSVEHTSPALIHRPSEAYIRDTGITGMSMSAHGLEGASLAPILQEYHCMNDESSRGCNIGIDMINGIPVDTKYETHHQTLHPNHQTLHPNHHQQQGYPTQNQKQQEHLQGHLQEDQLGHQQEYQQGHQNQQRYYNQQGHKYSFNLTHPMPDTLDEAPEEPVFQKPGYSGNELQSPVPLTWQWTEPVIWRPTIVESHNDPVSSPVVPSVTIPPQVQQCTDKIDSENQNENPVQGDVVLDDTIRIRYRKKTKKRGKKKKKKSGKHASTSSNCAIEQTPTTIIEEMQETAPDGHGNGVVREAWTIKDAPPVQDDQDPQPLQHAHSTPTTQDEQGAYYVGNNTYGAYNAIDVPTIDCISCFMLSTGRALPYKKDRKLEWTEEQLAAVPYNENLVLGDTTGFNAPTSVVCRMCQEEGTLSLPDQIM